MRNNSSLTDLNGRLVAVRAATSAGLVLFALLAGSCSKPAQSVIDVIAPNEALDQRYVNALRHNDVEALMSTYLNSPDTIEIEADGTLVLGWGAIRSYYEKLFTDVEFQEANLLEHDYQVHAGAVVGYGLYRVKLKNKHTGKVQEMTGRYLDVRVQRDGNWYYTSNMEIAMAPTAREQ